MEKFYTFKTKAFVTKEEGAFVTVRAEDLEDALNKATDESLYYFKSNNETCGDIRVYDDDNNLIAEFFVDRGELLIYKKKYKRK